MEQAVDDRIRIIAREVIDEFEERTFKPFCDKTEERDRRIFERLDKLNGWRNKALGILSLITFGLPAGIAIWAILS
jgi:hypothetical protein